MISAPIALPSRRSGEPDIERVPAARAGGRPGQSDIEGSTLSRSGTWTCRFSATIVPGMFRPPIRSCASGTAAPMRFELSPTRMIRSQPSPSAIWMVALVAPNRCTEVSAIW